MENQNGKNTERKIQTVDEIMEQFGRGKMELKTPIQDGENTITALHWDFTKLTGAEYADALDLDERPGNVFRLTNTQALYLFAAAAAKETKELSALDIRKRMGMMDAGKAIQLATVFFNACSRAADGRISKD